MKKILSFLGTAVMWIMSLLMTILLFLDYPIQAKFLMVLFVLIAIPYTPIKNLRSKLKINGGFQGFLLFVLFVAICIKIGSASSGESSVLPLVILTVAIYFFSRKRSNKSKDEVFFSPPTISETEKVPNVVSTVEDVQLKKQMSDLFQQAQRKDQEHETAKTATDLTPEAVGNKKRYYHYKDVSIHVAWQFCGMYGKSCESAGIKRGDEIALVFDHFENDPDSVAIVWNGETIGHMNENRMRGMVKQWNEKKNPVLCYVSHVGGDTRILLEFAFYGFVKNKN